MNNPQDSFLIPPPLTRRKFIRTTAQAAAAVSVAALAPYVARGRVLGANDRIGVGFVGVGGRGRSHLATVQKLIESGENLHIVAVCDAYGYRREQAAELTGARIHKRHAELLADAEVDAVCIASPDRLHVSQALDAIRAGKDVYCEKPMGHWSQFELSKKFCQETSSLRRIVQIGNQANSSPEWKKVGDLIRQGAVGRVQHVEAGYYRNGDFGERMRIPDPEARPGPDLDWEAFLGDAPKVPFTVERFFSWRRYWDYAGGPSTDLFPHLLTPFVSMLGLKFPSLAVASGGIFKYDNYDREVPDTFSMCLDYPERLTVNMVCTLSNDCPTAPVIRGDEGAIVLGTDWASGVDRYTLVSKKGERQEFKGGQTDTTRAHWQDFLRCIRTREKPVSDVAFGFHVQTALCMATLAFRKRKVATFDFKREKILL